MPIANLKPQRTTQYTKGVQRMPQTSVKRRPERDLSASPEYTLHRWTNHTKLDFPLAGVADGSLGHRPARMYCEHLLLHKPKHAATTTTNAEARITIPAQPASTKASDPGATPRAPSASRKGSTNAPPKEFASSTHAGPSTAFWSGGTPKMPGLVLVPARRFKMAHTRNVRLLQAISANRAWVATRGVERKLQYEIAARSRKHHPDIRMNPSNWTAETALPSTGSGGGFTKGVRNTEMLDAVPSMLPPPPLSPASPYVVRSLPMETEPMRGSPVLR